MSRQITVAFAPSCGYVEALFRFDDGSAAINVPELPEIIAGETPEELWSQTLRPAKEGWMYALAADSLTAMCRANQVDSVRIEGGVPSTYYAVKRRFTVFERTFAKPDEAMLSLAAQKRAAIVRVTAPAQQGENGVMAQTLLAYHPIMAMCSVYSGLRDVRDETMVAHQALEAIKKARADFWLHGTRERIHEIIQKSMTQPDAPSAPDRPRFHPAYPICAWISPMAGLDAEEMKEWMERQTPCMAANALAEAVCAHIQELFERETPENVIERCMKG